jgi:hypothetical protein
MLKVVRFEDKYVLKFLGGSKPNKSLMTWIISWIFLPHLDISGLEQTFATMPIDLVLLESFIAATIVVAIGTMSTVARKFLDKFYGPLYRPYLLILFCDIQLSLKYIHNGQTEMLCSHLGNAILRKSYCYWVGTKWAIFIENLP